MTPGSVVVFGSANIDLTVRTARAPGPGETVIGDGFVQSAGGKGANQAVAAARMGATTHFVGRVGDDPFGRHVANGLAAAGVDTTGLQTVTGVATGVAVIVVDDSADNRIVVAPGANARLDRGELKGVAAALDGAAVLLLQLEIPMAGAIGAAQLARQRGVTVVLDPAPAPPGGLPEELLRLVSILTPNEHEAALLVGHPVTGDDDASVAAAAEHLRQRGAAVVIVTLGERGAYWSGPAGTGRRPAPKVRAVDTTGAGDAFNGALAAALAEGADLSAAIEWGLGAGAVAVTRPGAQDAMPTRAEVSALLGR
jgi:ribokinase